ncbi:MAG: flippase [Nanoarchaeota archaeon]
MEDDDKIIEKNLSIVAKSSIFVFATIFLSKIFMYFYRIIIARYYGPEIYGLFSLALMVVGLFIAFASLGFSEGIVRFVPKYRANKEKEKIKYIIKFSRNVLLVSSVFSAVILYFTSEFISNKIFHNLDLIFYLKIFALLIPIQTLASIYFGAIRSHERIKANSFGVNILQNFFKLIFVVLFIYLEISSSASITFSYFLGIFIGLIFAYLYCKFKLPYVFLKSELSKNDKKNLRKRLFSYSWPLVLLTIIGTFMFWLDTFLIGFFKDVYWIGIYNAAIPIVVLLTFASEIFMQMFFPLVTRELSSKNFIVVRELSKQITKWIFILNLPLTILIFLFPGIFINFFFGADYLLATNALRILVLGQFISSISAVSGNLLLSRGKSKIILINIIFIFIINFALNWILIPRYGINGAAFATLISLTILSVLIIFENYYFNKILPFRRKMLTIFLISLIPANILFWISKFVEMDFIWLIVSGILFVVIYFGLIVFTKSFDKNDLMILKKIFRR